MSSKNKKNSGQLTYEQKKAYYEATVLQGKSDESPIDVKSNNSSRRQQLKQQEKKRQREQKEQLRLMQIERQKRIDTERTNQRPMQENLRKNIKQANGQKVSALVKKRRIFTFLPARPADIPVNFKWWAKFGKVDYPMFILVMVLLSIGLVTMFSASYAYSMSKFGDSFTYISKQLSFAGIGLLLMWFASKVDYHLFMIPKVAKGLFIFSFILMLFVLVNGITRGGAVRWIIIFGQEFQPSEIMKFALIIILAYMLQRNYELRNTKYHGFLVYALVIGLVCVVTLLQPHLSGAIILFALGLSLMAAGECNKKMLILMVIGLSVVLVIGVVLMMNIGIDYFGARWLSFTDPFADIQKDTYQTYQSLVTIGSGGMFGLGLGNSRQKYFYLPESQNDFVFAIICEELGFVGAMVIILLFVLFIFRGLYIASRAKDKFGGLVAAGLTVQIGLQALLNIAVVSNAIPNTGISLPFFSYGGTALVMQLAQMGVLLSISRQSST